MIRMPASESRQENSSMKKFIILAAVLAIAACDRSKPELDKTIVQMQQISAEKDSLLKDVMQTSQFIADVNTQLATVKSRNSSKPVKGSAGSAESSLTPAQQRAAIKDKITELTGRLNEAESRLASSRNRVKELTANNAALTSQLASYDSTIAAFKTIIDNQKTEIVSLNEQLSSLQTENAALRQDKAQLTTEKTQLVEDKSSLTNERNTVYYVIGTKDELLKKKIIEQAGGTLGLGKTQVPARDLNAADFTAIDKMAVSQIAFPKSDKTYKVITRQDISALETAPDKDGRIRGGLKIMNADKFWAASKFLIILEQ
jgi:predicted  nucleic acid-binding Zn-ribbon protein